MLWLPKLVYYECSLSILGNTFSFSYVKIGQLSFVFVFLNYELS
jgi:hypothetical protein